MIVQSTSYMSSLSHHQLFRSLLAKHGLVPDINYSHPAPTKLITQRSQSDMATSNPHIVFLHGAWHSPTYFAKITAILQDHLYVVHAQQLPSVGVPPSWTPPTDLAQDVAAARSLLDYAIADGNDVIVICHSWGGTIASSALVGYSKEERKEKELSGGVVKVGYMCAFMAEEGMSLQGMVGEYPLWYDLDVGLDIIIASRKPADML